MSPKKLILNREQIMILDPAQRYQGGIIRRFNNTEVCSDTCYGSTVEFTNAAVTCNLTETCQNCGYEATLVSCSCGVTLSHTLMDPEVCPGPRKPTR